MREREVIRIVAERLKAEGLRDVRIRYQGPGADIEGTLPRSRRRLFIEAKGLRRNQSPRVAIGEALLQILSRWDRDVVCALALPWTEEFAKILRGVQPGIRQLGLHVLLVRSDREIGYLHPMAEVYAPMQPQSLMGALEE